MCIQFKRCKLGCSVWKNTNHLSAIPFIQGQQWFSLHYFLYASKYTCKKFIYLFLATLKKILLWKWFTYTLRNLYNFLGCSLTHSFQYRSRVLTLISEVYYKYRRQDYKEKYIYHKKKKKKNSIFSLLKR